MRGEDGGKVAETMRAGFGSKLLPILTVLGFLVPIGLYFWLISAYGVDMLRADQWFDVRLIHDSLSGTLGFGELWAPHGENRVLSQNILAILLGRYLHYNVVIEEYFSAFLLTAALVLIVLAHRRRSPSTPWIAYCPAAFVLLTVAQWGGALYGYSLGWYIIIFCLALVLFLIDRPAPTWITWSGAVVAAVIASYSSLQGLFVWVAGLTIILQRRRPTRFIVAWVGAGLATAGLYFYRWDPSQGGGISYALKHPGETLQYFFFAVGDVVSVRLPDSPHGAQYGVLLFGVAIFAVAIWCLVSYGFRADDSSARPLGAALIWVGLLFAAGAAGARTEIGISNAGFSLYVAFDVLILLGALLIVIDRPPTDFAHSTKRTPLHLGMGVAVGALVLVQVLVGTVNGISQSGEYRDYELTGAIVTAKIRQAPDGLVASQLGAGYESSAFIRSMAGYACSHHLSLFSTKDVEWYESQHLPKNTTAPTVLLAKPRAGDVIRGKVFLDAFALDPLGVTRVQFFGSGDSGRTRFLIGKAVASTVGWLAGWDTRSVPNGKYWIQAVALSPGSLRGNSPWVPVQIRN